MNSDDISRIRTSFARLIPRKEDVGLLFYERLFAIAPEVRPLFTGEIREQARKLMDTLSVAVGALRDHAALVPTLQALGQRHQRYGVKPEHYAKVGEALVWTLEQGLGSDFDSQTRAAWVKLYGLVATTMESRVAAA